MILLGPGALAAPVDLDFGPAPSCRLVAHEIAMVGDVMQHGMQLRASRQADGTYSWDGVFDAIAPIVQGADLAIANLETPVHAGKPYGGFPLFNAPEALLDALDEAGFDVLQTANNHVLDRGREGVLATLEAIEARGFEVAGTQTSWEARTTPWSLVDLSGTRVAFLAYTYGTNGMPMPDGEPWLVNWLDRGFMEADVARAREHADVVVVGLHWGAEYSHRPARWQRTMAESLVDAGADIVMGSHPHVLMPVELIETPSRRGLVLYSLGNFVSNQRTHPRDGGVIARVTVARCLEDGSHHLVDARFTPVWVDPRLADGTLAYRVVPVPGQGQTCIDDLDEADCRRIDRFREHAASLLPAARFSTVAGGNAWTHRDDLPSLPWIPHTLRAPPAPARDTWPPPRLVRTQATH